MGERSRKGCCLVLLSPPCCVSGKLSSPSEGQRHSHWRDCGWGLGGEGRAVNIVPLVQNAIASSFIVVPISFLINISSPVFFFFSFFPPSDKYLLKPQLMRNWLVQTWWLRLHTFTRSLF